MKGHIYQALQSVCEYCEQPFYNNSRGNRKASYCSVDCRIKGCYKKWKSKQ